MIDYVYLVDNNALVALTQRQRSSEFFRSHCYLPDEVLREARGFPDSDALEDRRYETTVSVLRHLVSVMETVSATDTKLVDLYANRGNADPLIIACALDGKAQNEDKLFGPHWVVVSDDKAVRAKATEFEIDVLTAAEFAAVIERTERDGRG